MGYQYYITPTNFQTAAENGIKKATLEYRVHNLAWDMDKATTTPPKERKSTGDKWRKLAKQNGIPYQAFQKRVNIYGWEPERASSEPLQNRHEIIMGVMEARDRANSERKKVCVWR